MPWIRALQLTCEMESADLGALCRGIWPLLARATEFTSGNQDRAVEQQERCRRYETQIYELKHRDREWSECRNAKEGTTSDDKQRRRGNCEKCR